MKLLTVIFLTYYIISLKNQNTWILKPFKKIYEEVSNYISNEKLSDKLVKNYFDKILKVYADNNEATYMKNVAIGFLGILLYIIFMIMEFIYIIKAISVLGASKYITICYLIFWILILLKSLWQSKRNIKINKADGEVVIEAFNKCFNFSIQQFVINLVDVAYFGYMFYILFIL